MPPRIFFRNFETFSLLLSFGGLQKLKESIKVNFAINKDNVVERVAYCSAKATIPRHGILCLLDNKVTKDLKRHLLVFHNRSVESYKAEFGLPDDTPVTVFSVKRQTPLKTLSSYLKAA
jgi:predicted transcriptional regulator